MHWRRSKTLWLSASLAVLLGGIAFAETHHKLPGFRLLTFVQVFVVLAILTSVCRRRLQSALLVVTTLVFGLIVAEGAGNWVMSRTGRESSAKDRIAVPELLARKAGVRVEASRDPNGSPASQISSDGKAQTAPPYDRKPRSKTRQPVGGQPPTLLVDANLFAPTAGVGWRLSRAGEFRVIKTDPATGQTIYDVRYSINADLDRTTHSTDTGEAVVFLGDSLTFGSGVDDAQTMPQRFADLLGRRRRVVNLGVPGYSPAQILFQLQNGAKSKIIGPHPLSLIMLTGPYHASRTACKDTFTNPAPRYAIEDGAMAYKGPCFSGIGLMWREFLDNSMSYRAFVSPLVRGVNQADLDLYVDLVAAVSAAAQKIYGVKPLVPFVQFSKAGHVGVLERLRAKGVDAIDVSLSADEASGTLIAIPGDGHPTVYAHDVRAKMIKEALERRGVGLLRTGDEP